jgi:hypothetical protein
VKAWSDRPFPGTVPLAQVAAQGKVLGNDGGESRVVYEIASFPGWVAKLYKEPLKAVDASGLAAIIDLPAAMGPGDLAHVDACTAWPTARILADHGDHATVGVVMAKAPDRFLADFRLRGDRISKGKPLTIDWLIGNDDKLAHHGIRCPTADVRRRVAWEFLALGDLLDRHLVVYGDWSYRNCLWAPVKGEVFLLDMDSCRQHQREWVESMEWEDPLSPVTARKPLSRYNDRYKLALLAARCIAGERGDPLRALAALPPELRLGTFGSAVRLALTTTSAPSRPAPGELLSALQAPAPAADGSHVTGYRPVRRAAAGSVRLTRDRVAAPGNGAGASRPGSTAQHVPPPSRGPADGQRMGTGTGGAAGPAGQRGWGAARSARPYVERPSPTWPAPVTPGKAAARVAAAAVALLVIIGILIAIF